MKQEYIIGDWIMLNAFDYYTFIDDSPFGIKEE